MRIDVLSIEGIDAARNGWRISRDPEVMPSVEELVALDLPVNEFPTAHLNFQDFTILEREIFATPRSHVMWARTSHVDDPLKFQVPADLAGGNHLFYENCRAAMTDRKAAGASQDEWRENLPVTSLTSWTGRISYRDLVKITEYFRYLMNHSKIGIPLRERFIKIAEALVGVIDRFTGDPQETIRALATMQKVKFLHEGDVEIASVNRLNEYAEFHVIPLIQPLWMRAQIVRHRPLAFVDTFFQDFIANKDALTMTIKAPTKMQLVASKEYWRSIMSKRSCWLAQDSLKGRRDPWQVILDQFGFDESMLPCADGTCPYSRDAALRLTDADPGVPCPRYCNINNVSTIMHRDDMIEAARSRHSFWIGEIDK